MTATADDTLARFESTLAGIDVTSSRTTVEEFTGTLRDVVDSPAVGAPLPFEGVDYEGVDVSSSPSAAELREAKTGVTTGRFAIAELGTVAVTSESTGDEPVSLYPRRHVTVVAASDVFATLADAFGRLEELFAAGERSLALTTGPSATADMGALVQGVHGPAAVHVLVLEDR